MLLHALEVIASAGPTLGRGDIAAKPGASVPGRGGQHVPNRQPVNDEECIGQRVLRVASGAILHLHL